MYVLTKKQLQRKRKKTASWLRAHPEKVKEYDKKYLKKRAASNAKRRLRYRLEAIRLLGGKCSSFNCRWLNSDGTLGCVDWRLLHLDHKKGGGTQERSRHALEYICRQIIQGKRRCEFQLLCSNCNWLKAIQKKEFRFRYKHDLTLPGL